MFPTPAFYTITRKSWVFTDELLALGNLLVTFNKQKSNPNRKKGCFPSTCFLKPRNGMRHLWCVTVIIRRLICEPWLHLFLWEVTLWRSGGSIGNNRNTLISIIFQSLHEHPSGQPHTNSHFQFLQVTHTQIHTGSSISHIRVWYRMAKSCSPSE